jgi:hypothetical protein
MKLTKRTRLSVATCAASILCLAASAAVAGEITGNGKSLKNADGTLNGRSACAFSGRQDNFAADEGLFRHMLTQSWGQIFKDIRSVLPGPGVSCNPTRSTGEP